MTREEEAKMLAETRHWYDDCLKASMKACRQLASLRQSVERMEKRCGESFIRDLLEVIDMADYALGMYDTTLDVVEFSHEIQRGWVRDEVDHMATE